MDVGFGISRPEHVKQVIREQSYHHIISDLLLIKQWLIWSWPNFTHLFSAGQIAEWGADGVIIGSAMVKQLGEAASPKEWLHQRLEDYARSMKNALP